MQRTNSYKTLIESTQEKGLLAGPICKWILEQCIIGHRTMNVIKISGTGLKITLENFTNGHSTAPRLLCGVQFFSFVCGAVFF
jgi:hypothetical protein